jgi:hypothetical protein
MLSRVVWQKLTDVSEVLYASIIRVALLSLSRQIQLLKYGTIASFHIPPN